MNDRIEFVGNYNEYDCSIELSNLSVSDAGEWTCDLESYVWGPISGTKDTAEFNLIIDSDLDYNGTLIDTSIEDEDENENEIFELTLIDTDKDGKVNISYLDEDEDGKNDVVGHDYDQDGKYDKVEPIKS